METEAQKSSVEHGNDANKPKSDNVESRSSTSMAQEVDRARGARSQDQLSDPDLSKGGTTNSPRSMTEFAENSISAHLNPQDNIGSISRVADTTFGRQNVGSSSFEARTYAIQATMGDGRPVVDAISLRAAGTNYEGWRAVNPESGREYFYSNEGQRFEMVRGETGYTALKPMGNDSRSGETLAITVEPRVSGSPRATAEGHPSDTRPSDAPREAAGAVPVRPSAEPVQQAEGRGGQPQTGLQTELRPELINSIRKQVADTPELLVQLQRSDDPRAAALLQQLGYHSEVAAHGAAGLQASAAGWLQMLRTNEQLVGLLRGNLQLNNPMSALDANSTRANLFELSGVLKAFNGMQEAGRAPADWQHLLMRAPDGVLAGLREFCPGRAQDQQMLRETIDRLMGRRNEHSERPAMMAERARAERAEAQQSLTRPDLARGQRASEISEAAANAARIRQAQDEKELTQKDPLAIKRLEEEARRRFEEEQARIRKAEADGRPVPPLAEATLLAAMNAKKPKEDTKETKDDEKTVDATKKDDEKRAKYIVKQGDTLESIAFKMLRDKRLSGLIYDINKAVIPIKRVNGRSVIELKTGLTLWLPTGKDIKDYRVRLITGSPPASATAPASGTFPQLDEREFASAEEELQARFGESWAGSGAAAAMSEQPEAETGGTVANAVSASAFATPVSNVVPGPAPARPPSNVVPVSSADSDQIEGVAEMDASARAAFEARRMNVEKMLGPLVPTPKESTPHYMVRLGDTLKSIAMKHPALADIKLWRLLAQVNNIPTDVDERGNPVARVKRGQSLVLPMQEQIDAFRGSSPTAKPIDPSMVVPPLRPAAAVRQEPAPLSEPQPEPVLPPVRSEPSLLEELPVSPEPVILQQQPVIAQQPAIVPPAASAPPVRAVRAEVQSANDQPGVSPRRTNQRLRALAQQKAAANFVVLQERNGNSRLLQSGSVENIGAGLTLKLEAASGSSWSPVVVYEIYDDVSLRHEYKPGGARKTIRIDLPPQAAVELANNDLSSNWQNYCAKFRAL